MPLRLIRVPLITQFQRLYNTMTSLTLEPREKLLRDCLADCAQSLHPLEIRFAGGWVRDKLLGLQSHDIDVALSTLSGKDFGQTFLQFYNEHGDKYKKEAERLGIDNTELNKIVLVEEDAEKSKHLAVAKLKLFCLEVDLVNLRTEVYASDSRTPVVKMGTAEEDALRRDATINALFYNIHTEQVEDLTGKGLEDLKDKIMRTPLDPYQTFRDDPLRALRLIRFAARLDFEIDAAAQTAMKSSEIHQALRLKISRERVRAEIVKALEGCRPTKALSYIHELDLFNSCFADPADPNPPSSQYLPRIYQSLSRILENDFLCDSLQLRHESPALPWLLAAYTPWETSVYSAGSQAIKNGIKAPAREAKLLEAAIQHRTAISALVSGVSRASNPYTRSAIGMKIRSWGSTWGHQALYALLCDLKTDPGAPLLYETFLQHLLRLGLDQSKAVDTKPILDGRKIIHTLAPVKKLGPGIKFATDLVMGWQLDNPQGGVGECEDMLRRRRDDVFLHDVEAREGGRGRK
jgi:tRNA nucleotidyltransferase (CCA-adding enzyme)